MRRMRLAALATVLVASLGGCATVPAGPSERNDPMTDDALTLETAKADAIALGEEIASYFPQQYVTDSRTIRNATTLLPCGGEDRYGWPGRTTLIVSPVPDETEALEAIAAEWEGRSGWSVTRQTTSKGHAAVDIDGDDGTKVAVSFYHDAAEVWVDVVSPCFTLPGGYRYGTEY